MRLLELNEELPNTYEVIKAESKHASVKDFIAMLNKTYQQAAAFQISQVQNLINSQLEDFVIKNNPKDSNRLIDFHIELVNNVFRVIPHNLFTMIIVNGEYASSDTVESISRYSTKDYTYIFDALAQEQHIIPNNLTLHTLDGIAYMTLPEGLT